nr:zinc finger MYM-type protein 1-like [Onthophagus taurus]
MYSWLQSKNDNTMEDNSIQSLIAPEDCEQTLQDTLQNTKNTEKTRTNSDDNNNEDDVINLNLGDPNLWPNVITHNFRVMCTKVGPKQDVQSTFPKNEEVSDTTGEGLANTLLKRINELDLDIMYCRGQAYDNGGNMKGKYKGVQSRIISLNSHAIYVPCISHSFNLLICDAASSSIYCKNFFGLLQRVYCLFSASTKRWEILRKHLNITLKPLCDTRWEAKIDSVKAVYTQFEETCNALEELTETSNDNAVVSEAQSILNSIQKMPYILSLSVWFTTLSKINSINKLLQGKAMVLDSALNLINKINENVQNLRSKFNEFLEKARTTAHHMKISADFPEKRIRKRKRIFSELAENEVLENPEEEFRCNFFNVIIHTIIVQIEQRFQNIPKVISNFKLFTNIKTLDQCDLENYSRSFIKLYNNDVNEDLIQEISLLKNLILNENNLNSVQDILQYILDNNYNKLFPNVLTALKIFFTLPVLQHVQNVPLVN